MKYAKKVLSTFVALSMVMSVFLGGCGDSGKKAEKTAVQTTAAEQTAAVTQEDKSPVTFTYFTSAPAGTYSKELMSQTKIGKMIQEQTGVDIKFQYVTGDTETAVGIMIASGDYPDIMFAQGTATARFVDAGALLPLEELIEKHAPTLRKAYEASWRRMKQKDGHIYAIKSYSPQGDQAPVSVVTPGFGIQKQVLEELGWPQIKTVDQYFEAIKQYKEKHPQIEGGDAIGFEVLMADGWRNTIQWAVDMAAGYPNDGRALIDPATQKVTLRETSEPLKKYLKILNKAYNQGLVDKESFVQNYDKYKEKIASGRVIGTFDHDWEIGEPVGSLLKQNKEGRTYYLLPLTFDENTKLPPMVKEIPDGGEGAAISVKAEDKAERIMKFFEYLVQPETQKLVSWGIEGEDYSVENGRYVRSAEQINKSMRDAKYMADQGLDIVGSYGWPSLDGIDANGNAIRAYKQPEIVKNGFTEWDNKYLQSYGLNMPADLLNKEAPVLKHYPIWTMTIPDGSPAKIAQTEMDALNTKYWAKITMAPENEFDKAWDEYIKAIEKLPVQDYIKAIEDEIKFRNENW